MIKKQGRSMLTAIIGYGIHMNFCEHGNTYSVCE